MLSLRLTGLFPTLPMLSRSVLVRSVPSFARPSAAPGLPRLHPLRLLTVLLLATAAHLASAQLNITRQPDPVLTVTAGQPATFNVGVSANPAPAYQWRRNFYAIPGATGATYQIPAATQFDNDFYDVVITSAGTTAISQPSRLVVAPTSYPGAVTVDLPRSLRLEGPENPSVAGPSFTHAALPDGRFYLAGPWSSINGQSQRELVRFNANGSIDPTFTAPVFDARPTSLTLQPDGKLLVAGPFTSVGGVASAGITRLNPDGSRDTTFTPGIGFATSLAGAIHVAPNGNIYLSGGGIGTPGSFRGYIARLSPNGTLDTSFASPEFTVGNSGTNPLGFVFGPAGEIYVHGGFDAVNGVSRNRLARLLPNGQVDPSFNPGAGPNTFIYAIVVLSDGKLVIGGDFTTYNGVTAARIARINTNGTLDTTFATGSGFSNQVNFLAELPGGALFVGSTGNTYNGAFVGPGVRLTSTGALDSTFVYNLGGRPDTLSALPGNRLLLSGGLIVNSRPGVRIVEANGALASGVTQPAFRFPAVARVLAPLPAGKILVAGNFTHVNGTPAPFLIRLNPDLTRDTTYPNGPGPTDQVINALVHPDGRVVLSTYNNVIRLNVDGSTDSTFNSPSPSGFWFPSTAVLLRDGRYFVPTDSTFWPPPGSPAPNGFVILEANGTRATSHSFSPGPNSGSRITGVQRLAGGQLLITGSFSTWNGVPRNGAVRLNADGSVDSAFVPDGSFQFSTFMSGLARNGWSIQRDGRLIAISDRQNNDAVGRINHNGTRDTTFASGLPQLFSGGRIWVQPDDRIIVLAQGTPTVSGSLPVLFNRIAANGGVDGSFSVRGSGFWFEMMITDNGELLSSDSTGYLHRYKALPAPTIVTPPTAQSVVAGTNIQLRVTAAGDEPLAYQWFKDGAPVSGGTSATLELNNIQVSTAGSYTVTVTNGGGGITSPAALVIVTPRTLSGAVFGTIAGNAGTFAFYLRENGTGAFLAHLRDPRTVLVARNVTVGPDRQFRFTAQTSTPAGAGTPVEVAGSFASEGFVTGTLLGRNFAGPAATTSGSTTAQAGFYEAAEVHTAAVNYTILDANGRAYTVVAGNGLADAAALTFESGNLRGRTETNVEFHAGLEPTNGIIRSSLQPTSGAAIVFNGADNDKRDNTEKLVNISTRSLVTAGGSFTAGFVVAGTAPKPVLIRAIGPTLASFQVERPLSAARLEVFRETTSIAVGIDWGAAANAPAIAATAARVGAFPLPAASRDAALLLTLEPGAYSARVSGQGEATGVALVEVYDATEGTIPRAQRVVNISTLAVAGTGNDTLAAGFFVSGSVPKRLLIRGAGPALAQFGVSNLLARPVISVYSTGNTLRAQNAVWGTSPDATAIAAAAVQVGAFAFPTGSADAALLVSLAPGSYTAQVSGVNNTTGTALVEIYELP